jgi:hypothetical protein
MIMGGVTDRDNEGNFYIPVRHLSEEEGNKALVFELEIDE